MEFLNLFLEEAQDELDNILTQHERWSIDTQDDVALSTLRRAFQTLKNSGSLVGARHLADLARVTGNLLDRLLDRELTVDATLRGYLTDVVTLLPEIIDAEAERRKPATAELMRRGKALLESRPAPPKPAPSASHNVIALQQRPTNGAGQVADGRRTRQCSRATRNRPTRQPRCWSCPTGLARPCKRPPTPQHKHGARRRACPMPGTKA
jgi:chemotaxis protein histidine kinase CheA